ncbi:MAG: class I SAM-dependent methyltransferase [Candidatus Aenigmarchaeota archaeon]|nr:class I SAM-dependent methyltransferase [Candidatus Aenigmarchaeota archaeon]
MDSKLAWKQFANGQTPSSVELDDLFFEKVPKNSKVLDFGCAWGRVPFELQEKEYKVVGFDISKTQINRVKEFSKESNQKYKTKVQFDVADALDLPYEDNSFDACIMQAFMTTLINPEHRFKILDEAKRVLKKDGVLYMGVFGQTRENPKYKERYDSHFSLTKEKGTFIVTEDGTPNTPELYRAHHYTKEELIILLKSRFNIEIFKDTIFTSYHKNKVNGFIIISRNMPS